MDNKTYILQVNLPDGSKIGDEYKLINSLYRNIRLREQDYNDAAWDESHVENNPPFFKEKQTVQDKRIKVIQFAPYSNSGGLYFSLGLSHEIPQEKYEAVKKAIEMCLNDDGPQIRQYPLDEKDCTSPTLERQDLKEDKEWGGGLLIPKITIPYKPQEDKFKRGDVVIHKAGGLPMTVDFYKDNDIVHCVWFDRCKPRFSDVNENCLVIYQQPIPETVITPSSPSNTFTNEGDKEDEVTFNIKRGSLLIISDEETNTANSYIMSIKPYLLDKKALYGENINPEGVPRTIRVFHAKQLNG